MVWNNAASPLYKAVIKHNGSESDFSKQCAEPPPREPTRCESPSHEPARSELPLREPPPHESTCSELPRGQSEKPCGFKTNSPKRPVLSALTQNPDFMLIAALIYILIRENADKSLILALVMILIQ